MGDRLLGKRLGKYKVVEEIGRGGMATVYKAIDTQLKRVVALKVLPLYLATDRALVERLKREASAASRLSHPNIVDIYDVGEAKGYHYIAMRYVEGETLKGRLERIRGPLAIPEALNIFHQVASALEYAHSQGIIHRDIKPSNVLLATDGRVFLSDFGIARAVEDTGLTRTGTAVGTPAYMSPEQGQGLRVDARSDIYALGILLYEITTGRVPFDADTPYATVFAQIHQAPPVPREFNPDVSPALQTVILKALAKNPNGRYQNVAQMRRGVERAAKSLDLYEPPTVVARKGLGGRWSLTVSRLRELATSLRAFAEKQNISPVLVGAGGAIVVILCIVLSALLRPPMAPILVPTPSPTHIPTPLLAPTDTPTLVPTPTQTPTMTPTPRIPTSTPTSTFIPRPTATPRPNPCFTGRVDQIVDIAYPLIQVRGYVRDEKGKGIGGVLVRISAYEWHSDFGTWDNGYFAFDGLANAITYTLALPGKQATTVDAPMQFGRQATVIFTRGSCP